VIYQSKGLPLAVFTDIAERGPTFSLPPLQQAGNLSKTPPQFFVHVPGCASAEEAWKQIFGREPKELKWPGMAVSSQLKREYLMGYDWGDEAQKSLKGISNKQVITIDCDISNQTILFGHSKKQLSFKFQSLDWLKANLLLKIILNAYSTLVMGRIGRFEKNLMTYVRPTNGKLIDRSLRYVRWLLEDEGVKVKDDVILQLLFARLDEDSAKNESVVLNTFKQLLTANKKSH
jgi:N-acetylmuramic acid 6-phosphate etherase